MRMNMKNQKKRKRMRLKNPYEKGKKLEYRVVNAAKANGCIAFRSAGSHSPIDVVSIDIANREIRFVQCKAGKSYSESQREALRQEWNALNGAFQCRFEVI